jgi:hypothetical protein
LAEKVDLIVGFRSSTKHAMHISIEIVPKHSESMRDAFVDKWMCAGTAVWKKLIEGENKQ